MRKLVLILTVVASFGPMTATAAAGPGPDPSDPLNTCWGFKHVYCHLGDLLP